MGSLLFLNVSTVVTLQQMGRQQDAVVSVNVGVNGRANNVVSAPERQTTKTGCFR